MYCNKCGKKIKQGSKLCNSCGKNQNSSNKSLNYLIVLVACIIMIGYAVTIVQGVRDILNEADSVEIDITGETTVSSLTALDFRKIMEGKGYEPEVDGRFETNPAYLLLTENYQISFTEFADEIEARVFYRELINRIIALVEKPGESTDLDNYTIFEVAYEHNGHDVKTIVIISGKTVMTVDYRLTHTDRVEAIIQALYY